MSWRAGVILALAVLGIPIAGLAGLFGTAAYIEAQRVRDADPAFRPLLALGPCILSNPFGLNRYCCYLVEFTPDSGLTDANIAELDCLNQLPEENELTLTIATPRVTDASLSRLKAIRTLDYLDVTQSAITDDGVEELRQALPSVTVLRRAASRRI
jgi:hypothetical protein